MFCPIKLEKKIKMVELLRSNILLDIFLKHILTLVVIFSETFYYINVIFIQHNHV